MRSEDLGLVHTFACLHHEEPVWLLYFSPQIAHHQFVCFSHRDQPNVVFHRETVTMRAQVGYRNASLLPRWLDDAPQVICTSYHGFLDSAQLSCLILRHLFESFLYSVNNTFRDFHFISECVFVFFPLSTNQREKALLHHSVRTISTVAASHLLQALSGWRFLLPLALYSCSPLFFSFLSKHYYS